MKHTPALAALALASLSSMAQTLTWSVPPGGVAVAADAAENVFTALGEAQPAGDIRLTKTSPGGVSLFTVRFDNTDSTRQELATWVETDSTGGAYVSGTSRAGSSANPVNANGLLMRFASDGTLLWRRLLGSDFDGGSTLKVLRDAADNAYVVGTGPTPSGFRTRIHKYSPAGALLWTWFDTAGVGAPVNMKWGANGHLVVPARAPTGLLGGVAMVDVNGQTQTLLAAIPAYAGLDATADASGQTIVASLDPATQQGRLAKHEPSGAVLWQRSDPVNMARVEMAPDGGIVVGGTPTSGSFGVAFLKYDGDGNPLWANRDADGPVNAFLSHGQMRLDAAGNAYLAASNMSQMSVTRVNADGSTGWSVLAPFGYGRALAFGAQSQAVYVVGGQVARIDQGGTPPPPQLPDLMVTLADSPDPVRSGSDLAFTAVARNAGTVSAQAVSLATSTTLSRPSFVSVTSSQGSCTAEVTPRCTLGNLAPGASATLRWVVRGRSAGTFTTQAAATTTSQESNTGNNTASQTTTVTRR